MRTGLFAHRIADTDATGCGRYVRELVPALAEAAAGGETFVLASTPEPQEPGWAPPAIETRVVGWPRRGVQAAWCLGTGPRVERDLGHLDVVHLLHPFPPVRSAAPLVVTVQDVMPLDHPEWYSRSERWIYRRSLGLAARRARRVVVASAYVARRLSATLAIERDRIVVVPLGVSGSYRDAGSTDAACAACHRFDVEPGRFAVCVGAVSSRKNLVPVIRAMAELSGCAPPLLVVGPDGYGARETDAEIARLDGAVRVARTGYLPDDLVAALVRSAGVLVHPALEEGFGLVPLEAMAAGTPVIAARVGSIPEIVGDAAILVDDPRQPAAWASALTQIVERSERRAVLTAAGQRQAERFTWERTARMMLDIYRDVADA